MALLSFFLSPLGMRIAAAVAIGAVAIGGAWWLYDKIDQHGYDRAVSEIAAENQEALDRVSLAKNKLRSCIDRGKSWDQSSGMCIE